MLTDRQPEPGPTGLAAPGPIDSIETLKNIGKFALENANTAVFNLYICSILAVNPDDIASLLTRLWRAPWEALPSTADAARLAWQLGLAACLLCGVLELVGSLVAAVSTRHYGEIVGTSRYTRGKRW